MFGKTKDVFIVERGKISQPVTIYLPKKNLKSSKKVLTTVLNACFKHSNPPEYCWLAHGFLMLVKNLLPYMAHEIFTFSNCFLMFKGFQICFKL